MSTTSASPTKPTPASPIPTGTYFIYNANLNVYLRFTNASDGTVLTTWRFSNDTSQQVKIFSRFSVALVLGMLTLLIVAGSALQRPFRRAVLHIPERPLRGLHVLSTSTAESSLGGDF